MTSERAGMCQAEVPCARQEVVPLMEPAAPASPPSRQGVVVRVWKAADLAGHRQHRGAELRPVLGERVPPGGVLVVGRRQSDRHPRRESESGVVRLALNQEERPWTSRRHLELDLIGDHPLVRVLPTVKSAARSRLWGTLWWDEEPRETQRPVPVGRPLAMLLPGTPGYVVSFEYAGSEPDPGSDRAQPHQTRDPDGAIDEHPGANEDGETETDLDEDGRPLLLRGSEVEALTRIFRPALQWPPAPGDDTTPPWTALPHEEALRAAYRRIERSALQALGLPKGRAPDPALLSRLVSSGYLTYNRVGRVAEACDLPLHPRQLV